MNGGVFVPHSYLRGAGTSDYACLLCFWIIWKGGPGRHNGSELHMNGNTVSCYKSESVYLHAGSSHHVEGSFEGNPQDSTISPLWGVY
jgi:hypothetical protein